MGYMEIALLPKSGLRIKGKQAVLAIDSQDKAVYPAVLLMNKTSEEVNKTDETVVIAGTGEYEVGGIKMSGIRVEGSTIYSMTVDGVSILLGNLNSLEKIHAKLQDHHIIVVNCNEVGNTSFITALVENVIIFSGEKAAEVVQGFGKEGVKNMNKYTVTKDKLPAEVETILLTSSV